MGDLAVGSLWRTYLFGLWTTSLNYLLVGGTFATSNCILQRSIHSLLDGESFSAPAVGPKFGRSDFFKNSFISSPSPVFSAGSHMLCTAQPQSSYNSARRLVWGFSLLSPAAVRLGLPWGSPKAEVINPK